MQHLTSMQHAAWTEHEARMRAAAIAEWVNCQVALDDLLARVRESSDVSHCLGLATKLLYTA